MTISFQKLDPAAVLPKKATAQSAGYDLCACISSPLEILPGQTLPVSTGLAMALPAGYGGFIFARSGLGVRHGIVPGNCVGVIDADYRGELIVGLFNHSDAPYIIGPGERVAQLVVMPVADFEPLEAGALDGTQRGEGGFGSTGTK